MSVVRIFFVFLRLGLTSFGGPVAHVGYFREEFVRRRAWLDERAYGELVALCQMLPGPATSQMSIALGLSKGGLPGAFAAWLGFTLPSAVAMILFAMGLRWFGSAGLGGWLHGLKVLAVAVVAQALMGMGKTFCPDWPRAGMALAAAGGLLWMSTPFSQIVTLTVAGLIGALWMKPEQPLPSAWAGPGLSKRTATVALAIFMVLLAGLPMAAYQFGVYPLQLFSGFFRAGAMVFGGGHVVLPLLQAEVVPRGWVSQDMFMAGYGAAQAVPGPLFTFAAFLGAAANPSPHGWAGGGLAVVAIFLPSFLLVIGVLPWWENLRRHPVMQRALMGVNAGVVGVLLAAFYKPVCVSALFSVADGALAVTAFLLLVKGKAPPWLVAVFCAGAAALGWH